MKLNLSMFSKSMIEVFMYLIVSFNIHCTSNWLLIFIYKYKLNIFEFCIFNIFYCSLLHIYCMNFFFTGMIEKAGQDNNRNQKDSTNRKSVVVVDDDTPAQQKSGCCWHCCHSDASFFSPKRKNKQASSSLDGWFK